MSASKFKVGDRVIVIKDRFFGPTEAGKIFRVDENKHDDGSSDWLYGVQFDNDDYDLFSERSLRRASEPNDVMKELLKKPNKDPAASDASEIPASGNSEVQAPMSGPMFNNNDRVVVTDNSVWHPGEVGSILSVGEGKWNLMGAGLDWLYNVEFEDEYFKIPEKFLRRYDDPNDILKDLVKE